MATRLLVSLDGAYSTVVKVNQPIVQLHCSNPMNHVDLLQCYLQN